MSNELVTDLIERVYDRSRVVTDWKCPRARYWGYEHKGRGIRKAATSLELFTGITVHDSLATIATQHPNVDIDEIATTAFTAMKEALISAGDGEVGVVEYANEQATLTEGMLRGFYKHVWPRLLETYPVIKFIEQEVEYKHDGFIFMSKPDLILENSEGEWVYIEYKTTSNKRDEWINSWETAVQLHSSIRACEQTLGQAPSSVQVVGLYKGYQSYGKQSSPFCYAYKRNGNPPFTQDQVEYGYKAGFKRYPVWELEGGVKKWVNDMPTEILASQFPMTPPIFINPEMVDSFFKQRKSREGEIASYHTHETDLIDEVFPQKFDQCIPYFGKPCEFKKLCHGFCKNPLEEGFQWREAHHKLEADRFTEQDSGE